jgi:hypothetical protein
MAGGLMQLVAYGAQDVYLTGNPKVTFFQAVYKRHTNFAMENIEQTVNGTASNNGRVSVTVARNGDLIGDMYVELVTNAAVGCTAGTAELSGAWAAERSIKSVELSIGGQRIDKHYQLWWRLYSELYLDESKKAEYGKMTSKVLTAADAATQTVFLPLVFFFNRNPGLFLPLIALQYHEVRLDFDLSAEFSHYTDGSTFKVWGNYVYLDTEERRRFAQKGHEYLIEQVQHTGSDTVQSGASRQVRLSYNHPIKELVWCFNDGGVSNARSWNFTSNASVADQVVLTSNPVGDEGVISTSVGSGAPALVCGLGTNGGASAWIEDGDVSATASVGPLDTFKLILNGQDRMKEQKGKYFNQVQPFNHHTGNPYPGVYAYSFALRPEEHQPSGTCNFSRIDNAQVAVTLKADCENSQTMHMFATNYNVLRVQSGMGGLAFSN